MKKKLIIIAILCLIFTLVGFLVAKLMYKKAERNVATEQAVTVDLAEFIRLYKTAEDSANKLYLNKVVQLTGVVDTYNIDIEDLHYLTIQIFDSFPSINCTLTDKYKSIGVADTITLKGICAGIVSDINLIDCDIISNKKYDGKVESDKQAKKSVTSIDTIKKTQTLVQQPTKPTVFKTATAQISFDAGGRLEDIKAVNNKVEANIDVDGNINFKLAMLQFKFADALMQQHFNEEYVESSKFPTAKFIGKIINNNEVHLNKDGTYKAAIKGQLTIHGITKQVQTNALLVVKNQSIKATAAIKIILADFAVKSAAADEAELKIIADF